MTCWNTFSRILTRSSVRATGRYDAGSPGSFPGFRRGDIKLNILILGSSSVSNTVRHHLQIIGAITSSVFLRRSGVIPEGPALVLDMFLIIFWMSLTGNFISDIHCISLGRSSRVHAKSLGNLFYTSGVHLKKISYHGQNNYN